MKKTLIATTCLAAFLAISGCASSGVAQEDYSERTPGATVEDNAIRDRIFGELKASDARLADAHINVDSYNANVLLTGQVPSTELKTKAGEIAQKARSVRQVHNELNVSANTPTSQRMNDTWITGRIKTNLISAANINSSAINVITENGTVYLMGMVTRQQANDIVNAVTSVGGIQRVVKVFEYIN